MLDEDARTILLRRVEAYLAVHGDETDDRSLSARAAMEVIGGWTPSGEDHKARRIVLRAIEEIVSLADAHARGEDRSPDAHTATEALGIAQDEHGQLDDPALLQALALWLMYAERSRR